LDIITTNGIKTPLFSIASTFKMTNNAIGDILMTPISNYTVFTPHYQFHRRKIMIKLKFNTKIHKTAVFFFNLLH